MNVRRVTGWLCLVGSWIVAGPALGQTWTAPAASGATAQPTATPAGAGIADVVYLKDGSLLRGAIIELIKTESVTILLPSGQTRRFNMAEVTYAGPVATAPAAVAPPTATTIPVAPVSTEPAAARVSAPSEALVHLAASEPISFNLLTATTEASFEGWRGSGSTLRINHFEVLCTAPCDVKLARGQYKFSLSREGRAASADAEVRVGPGDTVHGQYKSFSGLRTAGVIVGVGGGLAGGAYALAGAFSRQGCEHADASSDCIGDQTDTNAVVEHLVIGLGVFTASVVAGAIMYSKHDEATVTVSPGVTPPASGAAQLDRRTLGSFDPRGLTLSARF